MSSAVAAPLGIVGSAGPLAAEAGKMASNESGSRAAAPRTSMTGTAAPCPVLLDTSSRTVVLYAHETRNSVSDSTAATLCDLGSLGLACPLRLHRRKAHQLPQMAEPRSDAAITWLSTVKSWIEMSTDIGGGLTDSGALQTDGKAAAYGRLGLHVTQYGVWSYGRWPMLSPKA
eukprot:3422176-Prymnesium_polylepis.1